MLQGTKTSARHTILAAASRKAAYSAYKAPAHKAGQRWLRNRCDITLTQDEEPLPRNVSPNLAMHRIRRGTWRVEFFPRRPFI